MHTNLSFFGANLFDYVFVDNKHSICIHKMLDNLLQQCMPELTQFRSSAALLVHILLKSVDTELHFDGIVFKILFTQCAKRQTVSFTEKVVEISICSEIRKWWASASRLWVKPSSWWRNSFTRWSNSRIRSNRNNIRSVHWCTCRPPLKPQINAKIQ